ncbi:TauD/TfdA family dioxygenase [Nonomuraea sp. NPDC000554]|uniref:TauD/TfdA family dioxygenase n=1 Tax=Nonomuraea sp. NPDC000554 TaxID=3154259 RepID=UPI00333189D4
MANYWISAQERRSLSGLLAPIRDLSDLDDQLSLARTAAAMASLAVPLKAFADGTTDAWLVLRHGDTAVMEGLLLGLSALLGECFAFQAERDGALVQDIRPGRADAGSRSSAGSSVELDLHTEAAFHPRRPDFLLLGCLRQPGDAVPTMIATAEAALARLTVADREQLRLPVFRFRPPATFVDATLSPPGPVLQGPDSAPLLRVNCNPGHTTASGAEAAEALDRLAAALRACATPVTLDAGDVLVLDNRRTAHGRPAFAAGFDSHDRWLKRVYVAENLWTGPGAPPHPTRVIT